MTESQESTIDHFTFFLKKSLDTIDAVFDCNLLAGEIEQIAQFVMCFTGFEKVTYSHHETWLTFQLHTYVSHDDCMDVIRRAITRSIVEATEVAAPVGGVPIYSMRPRRTEDTRAFTGPCFKLYRPDGKKHQLVLSVNSDYGADLAHDSRLQAIPGVERAERQTDTRFLLMLNPDMDQQLVSVHVSKLLRNINPEFRQIPDRGLFESQ